MRGQPRWRFLLVCAVFALLAVPLWRLTRPARGAADDFPTPTAAAEGSAAPATLRVEVTFSAPPAEFSLKHLERILLTGADGAGRTFTGPWSVALPKEGADLVLRARWPGENAGAAGPRAVRVVVAGLPGGGTFERTFWTEPAVETLTEVVTVPAAVGGGGAKF